tara:strand:+ start:428 stop:760 length:333 start_codon:yes stop_codon:yes gene_type:complete
MGSFDLSDLAKLLQQGQGSGSDSMGGVPLGVLGGSDSMGDQSMPMGDMSRGLGNDLAIKLIYGLIDGGGKKPEQEAQYGQNYGGITSTPMQDKQEASGGSAKGALSSLFG